MPDASAFDQLFTLLDNSRKIALAVSGGPDSTALMVVAAQWARQNDGFKGLVVLTVDHGLRENSANEAEQVSQWAGKLGLAAKILTWQHGDKSSGLQEQARDGRYKLMAKWCDEHGFGGIITAHNSNDQAETMLMRLARGSGVDGLSAMRAQAELFGLKIFRPLLDVSRQDLQDVLIKQNHNWIEDPSNSDRQFERVRVREATSAIEEAGIERSALNLSAVRLGRAREALEEMTDQFVTSSVQVFNTGHCELDRQVFVQAPDEIAIRGLIRLLRWAGGNDSHISLAKIERLHEELGGGDLDKHTLAGAQISTRKTSFIIGREFGRIDREIQTGVRVWDQRFVFSSPVDVRPYGFFINDDARQRPDDLPHFVASALPAICQDGGTIVVPHLDGEIGVEAKLHRLPKAVLKAAG